MLREERIDRGTDVVADLLEATETAFAVAHAAAIEAQHRNARGREATSQHHELAMAADTILRPADDDDDTFDLLTKTDGARAAVAHLRKVAELTGVKAPD